MIRRNVLGVLLAGVSLAGLSLGSCPAAAGPRPAGDPGKRWDRFAAQFVNATLRAEPDFAVTVGRREFGGASPDWSRPALRREALRLRAARDYARAFPIGRLSARRRLEREQVIAITSEQLFWRETVAAPRRNPQWYLTRLDPEAYTVLADAPPTDRLRGYIGFLEAVPRLAAEMRANLSGRLSPVFAARGAAGASAYARYFRGLGQAAFDGVGEPAERARLTSASDAAARAMDGLEAWFKTAAAPDEPFAIGRDGLNHLLSDVVGLDVPVEEVQRIGLADLGRRQVALNAACAVFAPGADAATCVAQMEADKPDAPLPAFAARELAGLRAFLDQRPIVSIPAGPPIVLSAQPPPVERNLAQVQFLAPPNRVEAPPGRAQIAFQTIHETWPGHYVRYLHARALPSPLLALWCNYATDEGWANYAEEMMWRAGATGRTAESHVAQLRLALIADVRLLAAIGLHDGTLSVDAATQLFERDALLSPEIARLQALRAAYDPGYVAYGLGELMVDKLASDWLARRGVHGEPTAADLRAFNDAFLGYGGLPIPAIRTAMMGAGGAALPTPASLVTSTRRAP